MYDNTKSLLLSIWLAQIFSNGSTQTNDSRYTNDFETTINKFMSQIFQNGELFTSNAIYPNGPFTETAFKRNRRAIINEFDEYTHLNTRWPFKVVPYVLDRSLNASMINRIQIAMSHWQYHTCIKFEKFNKLKHKNRKIVIQSDIDDGTCKTSRWGFTKIPSYVSLGARCETGNVIHEFGHVIGFVHEHQRPDRDENIYIDYHGIRIEDHSYDKVPNLTNFNVPYDLSSVMHYGNNNFTILTALDSFRNNLMGQRTSLSYLDIKLANLAYNCSENCRNMKSCQNEGFMNSQCTCVCPSEFTGLTCEILIESGRLQTDKRPMTTKCGGTYDLNENKKVEITTPNYPRPYDSNIFCNYLIKSENETRVKIKFFEIDLEAKNDSNDVYCVDRIELKYYSYGQKGPRFCGNLTTQNKPFEFMVNSSFVLISFRSSAEFGNSARRGFWLEASAR